MAGTVAAGVQAAPAFPLAEVRSSLPLEVALYFNGVYWPAFAIAELLLLVYKATELPYPPTALALEILFVLLYAIVEPVRLFLGSRGNKTESTRPLAMSLALAVPVTVFCAYMLSLQTFVLRLDVVLNGIALAFVAGEVLLGAAALAAFAQHEKRS